MRFLPFWRRLNSLFRRERLVNDLRDEMRLHVELRARIVFAGVALGLAVIGVFGVLQYSVSQRTPELGIRIALGAQPGSIHALVLKQAGDDCRGSGDRADGRVRSDTIPGEHAVRGSSA